MDAATSMSAAGNDRAIQFTGTWREYLPIAATNALLTICTLGIYRFWAVARERRYLWLRRFQAAMSSCSETDPESLAGILAHEVAHVRRRHVTEALIRELGIGALIRLFAGDIGANAEQIVALNYTRENETQADADAIAMLKHASISPKPTAKLFERLANEQDEAPGFSAEFLQSHPLSGTRAGRFAQSFDPHARYREALSRNQADALFDICARRSPGK